MPRLNRKSRHRRELTFEEQFALVSGLVKDADRRVRRLTRDEAAAYWADPGIRRQIMASVERHRRQGWPGRAAAWWLVEAGEDRPHTLDPPGTEALRLHELGELSAEETARLPGLIRREWKRRRQRGEMDPLDRYDAIDALAERLGVEDASDAD